MTSRNEGEDRDVGADVDAELRFHFEERVEALVGSGLTVAEARKRAHEEFGDVERVRNGLVAIDRRFARRRWRRESWHLAVQEVRQAARRLGRSPGFLLAAVLTLALGIGAVMAVFGTVDAVALRPLPYAGADRLVAMGSALPGIEDRWGLAKGQFQAYQRESSAFEAMGLYRTRSVTVRPPGGGDAAYARAVLVSAGVADVLSARVVAGRLFREEESLIPPSYDDEASIGQGASVVVVTNGYWRRALGSDPEVLGRTLEVNGRPYEIVGVLAPEVRLPGELASGGSYEADFWIPIALDPAVPAQNHHVFPGLGRLRPGVTVEAATSELARLTERFPETLPTAYSERFMRETGFTPELIPLREEVIGNAAGALWLVLGAVGVVLLITCANVANLFLVRAEGRRREMAVRGVLGARTVDLARHRLAETLLVTGSATVLGLGLAAAAMRLLVRAAPSGLPRLQEVGLTPLEVAVAVALALATALLFGLQPAGGHAARVLSDAGRSTTPSRRRRAVRNALVVVQVGMCFALLSGAGLLLRSFARLTAVEPGFRPDGVLTFGVVLPTDRYADVDRSAAFYRDFTARLESLPRVESAGAGTSLPLGGVDGCTGITPQSPANPDQGGECLPIVYSTPGYLRTLGIPVRGAYPDWSELDAGRREAVPSAGLARRFWGTGDPTGQQLRIGGAELLHRVSGVANDIANDALDRPPVDVLYVPVFPQPAQRVVITQATFVVRTDLPDPLTLVPTVRRLLSEVDPTIPLVRPRRYTDIVASSVSRTSFMATLLGTAALMALIIGAVGIYGVVSYAVSQRNAEIGVRVALGAERATVRRLVIGDTLRVAGAGIVLGLAVTLSAGRVVSSWLYDIAPTDSLTLLATGGLLTLVALLAGWLPARRALRVDPVEALRSG
ncbi:MAG: ABC transporter permease [Gemmatimonadota bacterium]|jgi:predicted permease